MGAAVEERTACVCAGQGAQEVRGQREAGPWACGAVDAAHIGYSLGRCVGISCSPPPWQQSRFDTGHPPLYERVTCWSST